MQGPGHRALDFSCVPDAFRRAVPSRIARRSSGVVFVPPRLPTGRILLRESASKIKAITRFRRSASASNPARSSSTTYGATTTLLHERGWQSISWETRCIASLAVRRITAGSSRPAITLSCPPQRAQVSMSIANTRFKRRTHVSAACFATTLACAAARSCAPAPRPAGVIRRPADCAAQ